VLRGLPSWSGVVGAGLSGESQLMSSPGHRVDELTRLSVSLSVLVAPVDQLTRTPLVVHPVECEFECAYSPS